MAEEDKTKGRKAWPWKLEAPTGKPSRVYIVEFIVLHLALLGVISAGIGLFNELVDETSAASGQLDIYSLVGVDYTLLLVSFGLVFTLLFLWLNGRINRSEKQSTGLTRSRRRRLVPYAFLTITSIWMVGYLIAAVYSLLTALFDQTQAGGEDLWRVLLKQAFAIALLAVVSLMVVRSVDPDSGSEK